MPKFFKYEFSFSSEYVDDFLIGAAALLVYLLTLAPSVTTGDSGELITAAATLSLAHPTGYPLYLLSGFIFTKLCFFLTAARALNLFSAVCAIGAALVLRRIFFSLCLNRIAAASLALLFAFSESVWSQATTARVYNLNALLLVLILRQLLKNDSISLGRAWLFWGLAMANHTVSILLLPPLIYCSYQLPFSLQTKIKKSLWSLLGFSLYLYLPIAASFKPFQNWGDPSTLTNFAHYITRQNYWKASYVQGFADVLEVVGHYLLHIPAEFTLLGAAFVLTGLLLGKKQNSFIYYLGLYLFGGNIALMCWHGSRSDIMFWPRYMITGWIGLLLLASLGFISLKPHVKKLWPLLSIMVATPALALTLHYHQNDRSHITFARDYSLRLLEKVEPNATIFAEGDNVLFPLIYLHHVEGYRSDVKLVLQGINDLRSMPIDPQHTPIYFTHHHNFNVPQLKMVIDGLAYRMVKTESSFVGRPFDQWAIDSFERQAQTGPAALPYLDRNLVGDYLIMKASNLLSSSSKNPGDAFTALNQAMLVDWNNYKTLFNAGLIYDRQGILDKALDAFTRANLADPRDQMSQNKKAQTEELMNALRQGINPQAPLDVQAGQQATIFLRFDRADLATLVLTKALALSPQSFLLNYNLAALAIAQQNFAAAKKHLQAALQIKPDDETTKRDLKKLEELEKTRAQNYRSN